MFLRWEHIQRRACDLDTFGSIPGTDQHQSLMHVEVGPESGQFTGQLGSGGFLGFDRCAFVAETCCEQRRIRLLVAAA